MRCPPPATGPTGRALAALLAFVLASAVVLLPTARPAQAHGTLAMSTPAANATVTEALTTVELYFTEQVAANAYFTVTGPGGGRVDNGWRQGSPRPLDKPVREYLLVNGKFEPKEYSTGFPAVVTLAHLPAAGQYAVSYLSVASDGEPVRGTMSFRYSGRATAAPQGWRHRSTSRTRHWWPPPSSTPPPATPAARHRAGRPPPPSRWPPRRPPPRPPRRPPPPATTRGDSGGWPGPAARCWSWRRSASRPGVVAPSRPPGPSVGPPAAPVAGRAARGRSPGPAPVPGSDGRSRRAVARG